jgi:histidyl-tRNA synthetase
MPITQPLKGFRDFLPEAALERQWLREQIVRVFERWGYDPMETPTLEPLELFTGQIGEDEKLFYSFKDHGDRHVALRYDQTVPTCRVVGAHWQDLPKPFRRYQIQTAFRAENTQKGRYREFLQCDADIFGTDSPLADAEVIALSLDIYRELGFKDVKALINNRALVKDIPYPAIVAIDKLKKIGKEGVIADMVAKDITPEDAERYFTQFHELKPDETIQSIFEYLKAQGFPESWYEFSPTLARSFSYSDGPIWEIELPGYSTSSVLGGERYDGLVEKIAGQRVPATGFAVGFDRTWEAAKAAGLVPTFTTNTRVLVTIFDPSLAKYSLQIASTLRQVGLSTELFPDPTTQLTKQLKYADKKHIPWVVIAGEDEKASETIMLKNLASQTQQKLSLGEAIMQLAGHGHGGGGCGGACGGDCCCSDGGCC